MRRLECCDGEADSEVDLASQAYQIWKNAIDANPKLRNIIEKLPDVVFSTRAHRGSFAAPAGVLLYMRTAEGNDALAWVNRKGENVTQSQLTILRAAACSSDTKAIELPPEQHDLVKMGVEHIIEEEKHSIGGQLGASSGARRRTYERLKQFVEKTKHTLLGTPKELDDAIEEIYKYPLLETPGTRSTARYAAASPTTNWRNWSLTYAPITASARCRSRPNQGSRRLSVRWGYLISQRVEMCLMIFANRIGEWHPSSTGRGMFASP